MPRQGMEDHRPRSAASKRLRYLVALAGDYLKYLFMKRRRLMHKVARRTLALVHRHYHHGERHPWPRGLVEREFSCADSPSPAFLAAKRLLLRSRQKGGGAAAGAVSSCFGSCGSSAETAAAPSEAEGAVEEEDYQLETEEEEDDDDVEVVSEERWAQCGGELVDVDDRAEEFINMFYAQLRAQSFAAVFQCSP